MLGQKKQIRTKNDFFRLYAKIVADTGFQCATLEKKCNQSQKVKIFQNVLVNFLSTFLQFLETSQKLFKSLV